MSDNSDISGPEASPILLVPYMWIGDFVRCHSVIKLLRARYPGRPIDVLTTTLCAPLLDYMPGVRKGIVIDLPRKRLALGQHQALARRLATENYGTALVMPRTWKSALAPMLAGIPERVGFAGEFRFGLLNDIRFGEKRLPRMIDRCGALALPRRAALPAEWPKPELNVPAPKAEEWRAADGLPATAGRWSPSRRAPSARASAGRHVFRRPRPHLSRKAPRSGCWAARRKARSPPKSWLRLAPPAATSRRRTSATPSWR